MTIYLNGIAYNSTFADTIAYPDGYVPEKEDERITLDHPLRSWFLPNYESKLASEARVNKLLDNYFASINKPRH